VSGSQSFVTQCNHADDDKLKQNRVFHFCNEGSAKALRARRGGDGRRRGVVVAAGRGLVLDKHDYHNHNNDYDNRETDHKENLFLKQKNEYNKIKIEQKQN
jgi:hypothetical protein